VQRSVGQRIEQHHVSLGQQARAAHRDEVGLTRPRANEDDAGGGGLLGL